MPRRGVSKRYAHGWTNLDVNDYQSSAEVSRKWREEVNNAQLAKIEEVNLMQKTMSEVHNRLDHYYESIATSKEVLTKHLIFTQGHPRSRKQFQWQFSG